MLHIVKESEGEECGRKKTTKRMSGRSRGEKERQKIKNPSQQREKRVIHPPADKNDVCYDSDRVK